MLRLSIFLLLFGSCATSEVSRNNSQTVAETPPESAKAGDLCTCLMESESKLNVLAAKFDGNDLSIGHTDVYAYNPIDSGVYERLVAGELTQIVSTKETVGITRFEFENGDWMRIQTVHINDFVDEQESPDYTILEMELSHPSEVSILGGVQIGISIAQFFDLVFPACKSMVNAFNGSKITFEHIVGDGHVLECFFEDNRLTRVRVGE